MFGLLFMMRLARFSKVHPPPARLKTAQAICSKTLKKATLILPGPGALRQKGGWGGNWPTAAREVKPPGVLEYLSAASEHVLAGSGGVSPLQEERRAWALLA
jgi:hypothetical protein